MSATTKKLIIEKTIELSKKKAFNKITINELVKACGITRNTFYYYFHDIYDVIIVFVEDAVNKIDPKRQEESIFDLIEFLGKYRETWYNLYYHVDRDLFEGIFKQQIRKILTVYYKNETSALINEDDFQLISSFYEESLYGLAVRYIVKSKEYNKEASQEAINKLRIIFDGQLELIIQNLKKLHNK